MTCDKPAPLPTGAAKARRGKKSSALIAANTIEADTGPLAGVEYTDDLAADSVREFAAIAESYRGRAKTEEKRFTDATDTEYWIALCFDSRADKEAFLRAAGVMTKLLGDKYLDGHAFAKAVGVDF